MFRMEKIQDTKHFKYWAPFRPFLGKFGQNSAADLYGRLRFYSAPFELCGRRIAQLGTLNGQGDTEGCTGCEQEDFSRRDYYRARTEGRLGIRSCSSRC